MEKLNSTILQKENLPLFPVQDSGKEYLQLLQEQVTKGSVYTALVVQKDKLLFGYFDGKELTLSADEAPRDKYIVEIRLFNAKEELLLTHVKDAYRLRRFKELAEGTERVEYLDNTSRLFGETVKAEVPYGFVKLYEAGRKISLTIPYMSAEQYYGLRQQGVKVEPEQYYWLVTRSYIEEVMPMEGAENADQYTGQSGFSCYRYVAICGDSVLKVGTSYGVQ